MVSPRRALILGEINAVTQFDPKRFKLNIAALNFTIEEARQIREWEILERAVDRKMEQLAAFLNWWTINVSPNDKRTRFGGNGNNSSVIPMSESQAKRLTGIGAVQKHRLTIRMKNPEKYRYDLLGAGYLEAQLGLPSNHRAGGTGNNQWHTPEQYIKMVRKVLGKIDLDPASSNRAQHVVKAEMFFTGTTPNDNGLIEPWHGRVFLNPPYSPKEITAFVDKMCDEYVAGRVKAAIMLTHNYTDSGWFQKATPLAKAICFPRTRIRFEDPDGVPCSPTQGQAFFYFGRSATKFIKVFAPIGFIVSPL